MFEGLGRLGELPRARLCHAPTPLEAMPNLGARLGRDGLYVKRDDCTGLALGGNKVRQLEFYLGEAQSQAADTILITGAVQSNFARLAAAAARKLGMDCHIQIEERVPKTDPVYRNSGNVLLDRILGATIHSYAHGEDETGADRRLHEIADELKAGGGGPTSFRLRPGTSPSARSVTSSRPGKSWTRWRPGAFQSTRSWCPRAAATPTLGCSSVSGP